MALPRTHSPAPARQDPIIARLADVALTTADQRAIDQSLFNGTVRERPFAVVACADESAVQAALRVAADHDAPVSVLAGGHDLSARAFAPGNLVLDVRRMNEVRFDPAASEVTIGGGALTRDLLAALPEDRVTATGTVLSVGVTGMALAGGYGRLTNRLGLASDCVKSARVALADGSMATASEREDADLLWALRGGGSGFGVVTSLTLAVDALPRVLAAMILFPLGDAAEVLLRAQDLLDRCSDDLSLFMGFMTAPTGDAMLFVAPMWWGEPIRGEALVDRLAASQGALVLHKGWGSYRDTFSEEAEKAWPKGRRYHIPTRSLRRIDASSAQLLVEAARNMTSPNSAIVLHDFQGAPTRTAPEATAFPLRESHFVVQVIAAWDADPARNPQEETARHREWAEDLSNALAAAAIPGGYVNLLRPDEHERVRQFYGGSADRLITTKRRVDPHDLFRSAVGRLAG